MCLQKEQRAQYAQTHETAPVEGDQQSADQQQQQEEAASTSVTEEDIREHLLPLLSDVLIRDDCQHTLFAVTMLCMHEEYESQACDFLVPAFEAFSGKVSKEQAERMMITMITSCVMCCVSGNNRHASADTRQFHVVKVLWVAGLYTNVACTLSWHMIVSSLSKWSCSLWMPSNYPTASHH